MTPQSYRQYLKICALKKRLLQYLTGGRNFSGLLVIAISCSNVNISASAVPKEFLARAKIPMISVELPFREMSIFRFSVAKFLAHTSNKLKQIKTFVQCSMLEKLPWNANAVRLSHDH